jgi:4-amino-4-deoxy-L-arabinose transferase-like glycosyltransferase
LRVPGATESRTEAAGRRPVPEDVVSRHAELAWLVVVLLVGLSLRLQLLLGRPLWIDEALSLETASQLPAAIWATSAREEPHPPGYYLLLRAWVNVTGLGGTDARWLSLPFGLASILATWQLGRRVGGQAVGILAAGLLALNPYQVFASGEVRMYALLAFLGLVATHVLLTAVDRGTSRPWAAYGAVAAAVGYVSYYGFLLLLAHLAWIAGSRVRPTWRQLFAAAAAFALCYLPWLPHLATSLASNPVPWRPPLSPKYVAELLATQAFGGHVWGTPGYLNSLTAAPAINSLLLALPFLVFAAEGVRNGLKRRAATLLLCSWVCPLGVVVVASRVLGRVAAYDYHVSYLQPYLAILAGAGLVSASSRWTTEVQRPVLLVVAALLVGFQAVAIRNLMTDPKYHVYRFDLVARVLEREARPGDVTIYFNDVAFRVLRWYREPTTPYVRIRPDPRRWSREATRPLLEKGVRALKPEHRRVWLVLAVPVPEGSAEDLVKLLSDRGYKETKRAAFGGVALVAFAR